MLVSTKSRTAAIAAARRMTNSLQSGGASRFMSKEIKFGVEGRAAMLNGVNLLADAVQVSLFLGRFLC